MDFVRVPRIDLDALPNDEAMRQGDSFGPRIDVPDDADEQTKLIAFTGRQP